MFEQVKLEPLQFYHSNCQPQFPAAQQPNTNLLLPHQNQLNSTLIDGENKNIVRSYVLALLKNYLLHIFLFFVAE